MNQQTVAENGLDDGSSCTDTKCKSPKGKAGKAKGKAPCNIGDSGNGIGPKQGGKGQAKSNDDIRRMFSAKVHEVEAKNEVIKKLQVEVKDRRNTVESLEGVVAHHRYKDFFRAPPAPWKELVKVKNPWERITQVRATAAGVHNATFFIKLNMQASETLAAYAAVEHLFVIKLLEKEETWRVKYADMTMAAVGVHTPALRFFTLDSPECEGWIARLEQLAGKELETGDTSVDENVATQSLLDQLKEGRKGEGGKESVMVMKYIKGTRFDIFVVQNDMLDGSRVPMLFETLGRMLFGDLLIGNSDRFYMPAVFPKHLKGPNFGNLLISEKTAEPFSIDHDISGQQAENLEDHNARIKQFATARKVWKRSRRQKS